MSGQSEFFSNVWIFLTWQDPLGTSYFVDLLNGLKYEGQIIILLTVDVQNCTNFSVYNILNYTGRHTIYH